MLTVLTVIGGSLIQSVTGVGAGFVVVPLLALIDLSLVPAPLIFGSMALSVTMFVRGRAHVDYRTVPMILLGIVPGAIAGAFLLTRVDPSRTGLIFGVVILAAAGLSARGLRVPVRNDTGLAAGVLSGLLGAAAGLGAPVLALLYQHARPESLRATLGLLYASASVVMLTILHVFDRFGVDEALDGLLLVPGYLIGYALSPRFAARIDQGLLRPAVLLLSSLAALALIARSL